MVGVGDGEDELVGGERVDGSLDRLAGHAQPARDPGNRPVAVAEHTEHLPARLRLPGRRGDLIPLAAHCASRLEHVGDEQRELIGDVAIVRDEVDNTAPI